MLKGSSPAPIAERAWRPASPQSARIKSLKPLIAAGVTLKPSAHLTKPSTFSHPVTVQLAELLLERGEHGKACRSCGVVRLLDGELGADAPARELPVAVEGPVTCDVRELAVDAHRFIREPHARRRNQRRGKREAHLTQAILDHAHVSSLP